MSDAARSYAKAPSAALPAPSRHLAMRQFEGAAHHGAAPGKAELTLQRRLEHAARLGHNIGRMPLEGPSLAEQIRSASSGGQPLAAAVRERLQPGSDADLSRVRIHSDQTADTLTRSVDAPAFTTGSSIFFRAGAYQPHTTDGLYLLAHEAEHTAQQAAGPVAGTPAPGGIALSDPADRFERAADAAAGRVARAQSMSGTIATSASPTTSAVPNAPARYTPALPVQRFRLRRGKGFSRLATKIKSDDKDFYENLFGVEKERRDIIGPSTTQLNRTAAQFGNYNSVDAVNIASTGGNILRGRYYEAKPDANGKRRPGEGQTVLLLSGSGGSSETFTEPIADYYAGLGSGVLAVNYRGFGESSKGPAPSQGGRPTQAGVYEDAQAMFNYLVQSKGVRPENIVVHGYSLGGGIAADLVSELAKQGTRVRGLVLHSAIPSAPEPAEAVVRNARGIFLGKVAGALTSSLLGRFNTRKKLARIAGAYPDLPLHFLSGAQGDQLAIDSNDVAGNELKRPGRTNVTATKGTGDHYAVAQHLQAPGTRQALQGILGGQGYRAYAASEAAARMERQAAIRSVATEADILQQLRVINDEPWLALPGEDVTTHAIRAIKLTDYPFPIEVNLALPFQLDDQTLPLLQRSAANTIKRVRDIVTVAAGGPVNVNLVNSREYYQPKAGRG